MIRENIVEVSIVPQGCCSLSEASITVRLTTCFSDDKQRQVPLSTEGQSCKTLYAWIRILYCDLHVTGSESREFKTGVMYLSLRVWVTGWAVEFSMPGRAHGVGLP